MIARGPSRFAVTRALSAVLENSAKMLGDITITWVSALPSKPVLSIVHNEIMFVFGLLPALRGDRYGARRRWRSRSIWGIPRQPGSRVAMQGSDFYGHHPRVLNLKARPTNPKWSQQTSAVRCLQFVEHSKKRKTCPPAAEVWTGSTRGSHTQAIPAFTRLSK